LPMAVTVVLGTRLSDLVVTTLAGLMVVLADGLSLQREMAATPPWGLGPAVGAAASSSSRVPVGTQPTTLVVEVETSESISRPLPVVPETCRVVGLVASPSPEVTVVARPLEPAVMVAASSSLVVFLALVRFPTVTVVGLSSVPVGLLEPQETREASHSTQVMLFRSSAVKAPCNLLVPLRLVTASLSPSFW